MGDETALAMLGVLASIVRVCTTGSVLSIGRKGGGYALDGGTCCVPVSASEHAVRA